MWIYLGRNVATNYHKGGKLPFNEWIEGDFGLKIRYEGPKRGFNVKLVCNETQVMENKRFPIFSLVKASKNGLERHNDVVPGKRRVLLQRGLPPACLLSKEELNSPKNDFPVHPADFIWAVSNGLPLIFRGKKYPRIFLTDSHIHPRLLASFLDEHLGKFIPNVLVEKS